MSDTLITIVAILLAAILMFMFPLMSVSERSDDVSQLAVQTAVNEFVDTSATIGKITLSNYNELISRLNATGNPYNVEIEHKILDENIGKKSAWTQGTVIGENVYYSFESYDVEQKFYHRYELENNVLKCEEWKYVQTNSDGDINIYTVERKPIEFGDDKPVVTNKILFSDEVWKVQDTLLRLNLNNTHSLKLNESEEIINYYLQDESKKTLSLSSLNSTSFYLDYVQRVDEETVAVDIKIEFKDSLFLSSNTIDGKDSSTTIKCSYDNFDILYPKLK